MLVWMPATTIAPMPRSRSHGSSARLADEGRVDLLGHQQVGLARDHLLEGVARLGRVQAPAGLRGVVAHEDDRAAVRAPVGEQAPDVGLAVGVVARAPRRVVEGLLDVDEHERGAVGREHGWTVCSGSLVSGKLETYRSKRSAQKTPEPMGEEAPSAGRPALRRPGAPRHPPALGPAPGARRRPRLLRDPQRPARGAQGQPPRGAHRGPSARVPRVRGRHPQGPVRRGERCASGTAAPTRSSSGSRARSRCCLHGERVQGRYALFPIDKDENPKNWMIHRMDPPADAAAGEPMPEKIVPMMARTGTLPRDDEHWAFEVKWDGVRAVCHSEPGRMRLHSRNLLDITPRYPEVGRLNRALSHHRAVLDGEIVALDAEGRPSFGALQRRMHVGSESAVRRLAKETPVTYVIFDLLWLDGHSLMELPYTERRARLAELELGDGGRWRVPDYVVGHGAQLLAATERAGPRGRHRQAPGLDLRAGAAHAVVAEDQEHVAPGGRRRRLGARRRQAPRPHRRAARRACARTTAALRHVGRVGTGFTEAELDRLAEMLRPLEREDSPFAPGGPKIPRGAVFADPELVAEVEFREWTDGGQLRAPSYKGLRDDKPAELVVREEANADRGRGRRAPGEALEPRQGPLSRGRLRQARRHRLLRARRAGRPAAPRGPRADAQALPQRRRRRSSSTRRTRPRTAPTGCRPRAWARSTTSLAEDEPTLVWLANLADLELHTSLALADDARAPDARRLRPRSRPAGDGRRVLPRRRAAARACSRASVSSASPRPRARRACRSTSRSTARRPSRRPRPSPRRWPSCSRARSPGSSSRARPSPRARARCSSTGARTTSTRRRSTSTRCARCARPTVSTPVTWDEVRAAQKPEDLTFEAADVLRRVDEHGDLFAPVLTLVQRLPGA